MKKLFCFMLALFLVLCIGCKTIDNASSLITQLNNSSVEESSSDDTATQSTDTQVSEPTPSTPTIPQPPSTPSTPSSQVEIITEKVKESDIVIVKPEPVVIKGEKPMSYSYITDEQKRIYEILRVAIRDMEDKPIDLQMENAKGDASTVDSDVNVAYRAISFDNPEYFWFPSGYALMKSGDDRYVVFKLKNDEHDFNYYHMDKSERDTMKKQLDAKVSELANAAKSMGAFEAEVYFHDYLCNNITYTKSDDPMVYTTYGALVNGKAVCEGYSRAMQLLCDEVGIPCGLVYGSSRGEGHMWNLINLDDGWYHLDVTWDDDESNGVVSHRYFNVTKSDIIFQSDHIISDAYKRDETYKDVDVYNFLSTSHNNKKLNYFEWLGFVVKQDMGEAGVLAKYFVDKGNTYFEIKNNTTTYNRDIIQYIVTELGRAVRYYETNDIITIIL